MSVVGYLKTVTPKPNNKAVNAKRFCTRNLRGKKVNMQCSWGVHSDSPFKHTPSVLLSSVVVRNFIIDDHPESGLLDSPLSFFPQFSTSSGVGFDIPVLSL